MREDVNSFKPKLRSFFVSLSVTFFPNITDEQPRVSWLPSYHKRRLRLMRQPSLWSLKEKQLRPQLGMTRTTADCPDPTRLKHPLCVSFSADGIEPQADPPVLSYPFAMSATATAAEPAPPLYLTPPVLLAALQTAIEQLNAQLEAERDVLFDLWDNLSITLYAKRGTGPGVAAALDTILQLALQGLQLRFAVRVSAIAELYLETESVLEACHDEGYHEAGERYLAHVLETFAAQQGIWMAVLAAATPEEGTDPVVAWGEFVSSLALPDDELEDESSRDEELEGQVIT